jgi:lipopolysaccharide heptosyltransferase I
MALKILILKPSSLGDVIQALPVARILKRHFPHARIHWWIDASLAPLLEADPDLAGLVLFQRKRWASPRYWHEVIQSIHWLRKQEFDWVIDLQGLIRSGAFAWLASGKLLAGLDEPREGARGFYDIIAPRASFHTHAADWYLSLLPLLGVPVHPDFEWLPRHPEVAATVARRWPVEGRRWIILLPGARWLNKRWPVAHFESLVRELSPAGDDVRFAILGSREDAPLGARIASANPGRCLDLTGQTSLPEMVEWIRLSSLTVSNDTGPMHAAAAMGRPVIGLFGPTEPRRTGPYGALENVVRLDLPCSPCLSSRCKWREPMECLNALPVSRVLEAAFRLLRHGGVNR